ncbi:MAG: phospho-sugar mutase [Firmicutes bacterium]|nr:phospho-sugar mutase [Bacillota bacterium]
MYKETYRFWVENPYFDALTRKELWSIAANEGEIEDRFYRDLEFGTGGLRGLIGAGTNRINRYTVRRATQGLAGYIAGFGMEAMARGVVIAHDSRRLSPELAEEAALVLCTVGIKAYLFESLRPTPVLSFAVRELRAVAGVVITASHNPRGYNGYKVYWEDGGQVTPCRARAITTRIQAVADITRVVPMERQQAVAKGLLVSIGEEIDRKYVKLVKGLALRPGVIARMDDSCKVVYSPLHGAGNMMVRRVLAELGFRKVLVVPEQEAPDGEFPTVRYPNPEAPDAFRLALELAEKEQADVIMATDPDADRLGVACREEDGSYRLLTGNQIGVLLADYILARRAEQGDLPANGVIVKTIATSNMVRAVARQYGIEVVETLTGFKFIGEKIAEYEATGEKTFFFGFEESYGYLAGTFVRDKDAVIAAALVAEAVAYYKSRKLTLGRVLETLYERHGYFLEDLRSITFEGRVGQEKIQLIMEQLRDQLEDGWSGLPVIRVDDYLVGRGRDLVTGEEYGLVLSQSDVLHYHLVDGGFLQVRPSGTESKIKLYVSVAGKSREEAETLLLEARDCLVGRLQAILGKF